MDIVKANQVGTLVATNHVQVLLLQVLQLPAWPGRAWQLVADTGKVRYA